MIKQLNKKLRLMEGFESLESAERYIRLLVGCYRFKRFTDSCRAANNGKSPLELAGVDLEGRDWLSFLRGSWTTPDPLDWTLTGFDQQASEKCLWADF